MGNAQDRTPCVFDGSNSEEPFLQVALKIRGRRKKGEEREERGMQKDGNLLGSVASGRVISQPEGTH